MANSRTGHRPSHGLLEFLDSCAKLELGRASFQFYARSEDQVARVSEFMHESWTGLREFLGRASFI
jgi:hypothetical protein